MFGPHILSCNRPSHTARLMAALYEIETLMKLKYYGVEFIFTPVKVTELSLEGILNLEGEYKIKMNQLTQAETEAEEKNGSCWYLDENGERLEPDELFKASPWSMDTPDGEIKLLRRFQNNSGEIRLDTQEGYPGELFKWVREQN